MKKLIENMNFSEIVWILNEPNRPSGWSKTIREVIANSFIVNKQTPKILEIGSNTGFSSIEFWSLLPEAIVTWIDINETSIKHALIKKEKFQLDNVSFILADWQKLPFWDETFDLLFSSNTTSFIKDKDAAVSEYYRVLKNNGILATVPIYYKTNPPEHLIEQVELAIWVPLNKTTKKDWDSLFEVPNSKIIYRSSHYYEDIPYETIEQYTDYVIQNANLSTDYSESEINLLREKLLWFYVLFNENLKYCWFDVILLMKNYANSEPELYLTN